MVNWITTAECSVPYAICHKPYARPIRSHHSPHIEVIFFMAISNFKQQQNGATERNIVRRIISSRAKWNGSPQNWTEQNRTGCGAQVLPPAPVPFKLPFGQHPPRPSDMSWPQSRAENIQTIRICVLINKFACENHFDCLYQAKLVSNIVQIDSRRWNTLHTYINYKWYWVQWYGFD